MVFFVPNDIQTSAMRFHKSPPPIPILESRQVGLQGHCCFFTFSMSKENWILVCPLPVTRKTLGQLWTAISDRSIHRATAQGRQLRIIYSSGPSHSPLSHLSIADCSRNPYDVANRRLWWKDDHDWRVIIAGEIAGARNCLLSCPCHAYPSHSLTSRSLWSRRSCQSN